ncbi:MAG: site-specific DNA-methyltransferase [Chloroflexi bacterium]|nr:site-specific DNA-methyltransferase [Chloroflexota bacterium]
MTTHRHREEDGGENPVADYRYDATRKNNPPATLASHGRIQESGKQRYYYDPHLPPNLRFDGTGQSDRVPELLDAAKHRALTEDEVHFLKEATSEFEPWLEWTGKREGKSWFEVDPVALHIHDRVSAQATMRIARRQNVQRDLWADPVLDYHEAVQFYRHDVDWSNRLILGDSLLVMNSLSTREDMAGQVQMIYLDPPYGIGFRSNFQPLVNNRNVSDRDADLTREPEMVKAYRDTWTLGVHTYLTYLRDRITAARHLLSDSGSIFVQIGDENVHRVRAILDEVFGEDNFVVTIPFQKKAYQESLSLASVNDYILWVAKNRQAMKFRPLYIPTPFDGDVGKYNRIESPDFGIEPSVNKTADELEKRIQQGWKLVREDYPIHSQDPPSAPQPFEFQGVTYEPPAGRHWSYEWPQSIKRLALAGRLRGTGNRLYAREYWEDSPIVPRNNFWSQLKGPAAPRYVVETTPEVIQRCILMTTDPGDLVLDPTCGSGTTAYVAEQWGRRWITIDTSRVAISLARQRLLTATFDYYKTVDGSTTIGSGGFHYQSVPQVTLGSIAHNVALDPIFAKWEPLLDEELDALNGSLAQLSAETRANLLANASARHGARKPSSLPKDGWEHWEVPFDVDPAWPRALKDNLEKYRKVWRGKMDEVNACIAANAKQEVLVDRPLVIPGVVRVSGPFTVESVHPLEESLGVESPIGGGPQNLDSFGDEGDSIDTDAASNSEAFHDTLMRLLRSDGVRFHGNGVASFAWLERLAEGSVLHAEGEWEMEESEVPHRVAVSFGPQYGPVTAKQVEESIRAAFRRGYDALVFAGFGFDGAAQAVIQSDASPSLRLHMAHVAPDVNMGGLLKDARNSQLFSVSGLPRTKLERQANGEYVIEMEGVDIYDPVDNTIVSASAENLAAWFVDGDYDGRTFCISQAFFPDSNAWKNLPRSAAQSRCRSHVVNTDRPR